MTVAARPTRIVIVGSGPRGVSVLERIVARAAEILHPVEIVLIDPFVDLGGRVWRVDQPDDLLMNTFVTDNTVFPDEAVRVTSPVGTGPSFADWLGTGDAGAADGRAYAPRAVYGHYLRDALARIRRSAPAHVRLRTRAGEACDVTPQVTGYRLRLTDGDVVDTDAVVLATGYLDPPPPPPLDGVSLIGCGHPTEYPLDTIPADAEVLVRGAGLNAFDVIARLTVGRGGTFDGGRYRPSGDEPHLWITSRRGVPYRARVDRPDLTAPLVFLGEQRVAELLSRRAVDFAADVLPLFLADLEIAWYSAMSVDDADVAGLLRILTDVEPGSPERAAALDAVPTELRFDPPALLDPLAGRRFRDLDGLRAWWRDHLERDYAAATEPVPPPEAAVAAAVRLSRPALRRVITAGTLTGESYRRDVTGSLNGWMNFVSGGPPAMRIRQLRGLLDAGVVDVLGPQGPEVPAARFTVTSAIVPGLTVTPDHVIDARLPSVDVTSPGPGVIRTLLAHGLARPHRLPAVDGRPAPPTGALDVEPATGRVVDPRGEPHFGLFAVGIPLEGLRWTTAIGARPGTDAEFFHETDAVAAVVVGEVLAAAHLREFRLVELEERS